MTAPLAATLDLPFDAPPPPGTLREVAPGVHWLRMPLPFALDHINLWLLPGPLGPTLIDTGYGNAATRALWETHFVASLRGATPAQIVATHYHPDHLGNAAWLARRFGCTVKMAHGEFLAAHAVIDQRASYGLPEMCALFLRHGMGQGEVDAMAAKGNQYKQGCPEAPATYDRLLHGDTLDAGTHRFAIITGRGHSPEHQSLFAREAGLLISGDMLLPRISTNVSVWPPEPDGDPLDLFLRSLADFEALPPDTLVLPSHGMPFRGIALRVAQLRAHHAARLDELARAVDAATAPLSAADLIPVLFRRELDLQQRFFAMGEAIAHLNHLWRRGRIVRDLEPSGAIRFRPAR